MPLNQQERNALAKRIYEAAHLIGTFQLRSGVTSTQYFDKYRFESDPALLREIARALVELLPGEIDGVAGLELGGVPLATAISLESGAPAYFVRKEAKTYGTCRLAEGGEIEGKRLAVIEDVITSGGQAIASCRELIAAGAEVASVICVIDRESDGRENIAAEQLELVSLFKMNELMAIAPSEANA